MNIPIIIKNVYGKDCVYAQGDAAPLIEKLTGRKTLSTKDFFALKSLGHTFSVETSAPEWIKRLI